MLAERLVAERQVLCIVNSRKQARAVYELVRDMAPESQPVYHLSTLMHPTHRSQVLDEIREIVVSGGACTVVATSLVEAGVDLDFETVYRAVSGIDSIVQAAGRCNREMGRQRDKSIVYLFEPETPYALPAELSQRIAITNTIVEGIGSPDFDVNLDDLSVISRYFARLHSGTINSLDEKQIVRQLSQYPSDRGVQLIPFDTVAGQVCFIEQRTYNVIIARHADPNDVESMMKGCASREQMRRLGRYSVSVYRRDRDALIDVGAIRAVDENTYVLDDVARYRDDIGLDLVIIPGEAVFL